MQSASDQYHEQAREIVTAIDHGDLLDVHITDHVLAETLNVLTNKIDHRTATAVLDRLTEGTHFELHHSPNTDFNATQVLFRQHSHLSFVDASIVAHMRRNEIEYLYSFDDDFDGVDGVTRLNAPIDPRN